MIALSAHAIHGKRVAHCLVITSVVVWCLLLVISQLSPLVQGQPSYEGNPEDDIDFRLQQLLESMVPASSDEYVVNPSMPYDDVVDPLLEAPQPWNKQRKERLRYLAVYGEASEESEDNINMDIEYSPPYEDIASHFETNEINQDPDVSDPPHPTLGSVRPSYDDEVLVSSDLSQPNDHVPLTRQQTLLETLNQLRKTYALDKETLTREYQHDMAKIQNEYSSQLSRLQDDATLPVLGKPLDTQLWNAIENQVLREVARDYPIYIHLSPAQVARIRENVQRTTHQRYATQKVHETFRSRLTTRTEKYHADGKALETRFNNRKKALTDEVNHLNLQQRLQQPSRQQHQSQQRQHMRAPRFQSPFSFTGNNAGHLHAAHPHRRTGVKTNPQRSGFPHGFPFGAHDPWEPLRTRQAPLPRRPNLQRFRAW